MTKTLIQPYIIRRASVNILRLQLSELRRMHDKGDRRPEVAATHSAITAEIERRELRVEAKPAALISRGAAKLVKIGELRSRYDQLAALATRTEVEQNTLNILEDEMDRRKTLAKKTYWRRRKQAQAFEEGASA